MPKIYPKTNSTKNFVSISKAAKFVQVSPDTLRNWEKEGKLLPSRTSGGARRYSMDELVSIKKEFHPFVVRKNGLVSISNAARALQVSPDTLRNWDKKGLIESQRSKGGARRFTRDEIKRLQEELGIEVVKKVQATPLLLPNNNVLQQVVRPQLFATGACLDTPSALLQISLSSAPKISHEVHNFSWLRITSFTMMVLLVLGTGWFTASYISPLEKKVNETSGLVAEMVQSIESLQRGVLGIQVQPSPSPVDTSINTGSISNGFADFNSAGLNSEGVVVNYAEEPIVLDSSLGKINCSTCLTTSSAYISAVTNPNRTLNINLAGKIAEVSLNTDHTNIWSASQFFKGGVGIGTDFTSQLFQLNPSLSNPVVMTAGGNIGIGITSPVNKLEVAGAQTIGADYAGVYTAPANGLLVQGNVGIGISAPSYRLDVNGGARFGCQNTGWNSGPATDCSDIAEVYLSDGSVDVGEIVAIGNKPDVVTKSRTAYQQNIIGVHSTSPGLLIGGQTVLGSKGSLTGGKIPVALTGRVPVKVSDENGPVKVGDYLTSSSIPGVAMKAIHPGPVIGQTLESFNFSIDNSVITADTRHLIDIKAKIGTILTFVNVSYADPGNFLASLTMDDQGNLIIPKLKAGLIFLDPSVASASSQLAVNSGQLIMNTDPKYTSPGPQLASNNNSFVDLSGEIASLEDRIKSLESIAEVQNQEITRLSTLATGNSSTGNVGIGTTASSAAVTTATSSAQIITNSEQVIVNRLQAGRQSAIATASATPAYLPLPSASDFKLTPPDILLASASATFSDVKVMGTLSSDKLFTAQDSKISGDLSVFGKTILANTNIAGDLAVDGTLSVNGNSINAIGSPTCSEEKGDCGILYLQSSALAYSVNFFNGLVTIDKTGNLRAQTVIVAEFKAVANKISGSAKIIAGARSVDLENPLVKHSSRILITPTSETDLVLAVTDKDEGKKFTVSIAQTAAKDIIFDWFMVGESPE